MDRRNLMQGGTAFALSALAGAAAAAPAAPAARAGTSAAAGHEHHHHHGGAAKYQALTDTSLDCIGKAEACLAHCLVLLGQGEKEMAACAQSVNQLLAICTAMVKLSIQESGYLPALAKIAATVCADCEKQCRKHEKKHAQCKACADGCAACLKQCKAITA